MYASVYTHRPCLKSAMRTITDHRKLHNGKSRTWTKSCFKQFKPGFLSLSTADICGWIALGREEWSPVENPEARPRDSLGKSDI